MHQKLFRSTTPLVRFKGWDPGRGGEKERRDRKKEGMREEGKKEEQRGGRKRGEEEEKAAEGKGGEASPHNTY